MDHRPTEEPDIYRSPQAELVGVPATGAAPITPLMLDHLRRTRPWVTLIAVVGTVGTGLAALVGVVAGVAMAVSGEEGAIPGALMGLLYVGVAAIYGLFTYLLWRYAGALRAVGQGAGSRLVEVALDRQRAFWRASGVMTLVVIGLYGVAIVVAIVVAIFAAAAS